ncbi:MAG: papain-like cysteine peptidase [Treponema sp.]|nr:papain-like cysteine peptidase [Treponema sp.]
MGENCLPDNILSRNDLKSFSSPFSYCRSNIEYILAFEKDVIQAIRFTSGF